MFSPIFEITSGIAKDLISIEIDRQFLGASQSDVAMLTSLQESSRLVATHYSTQIEGNRLTLPQVEEVLGGVNIPGRERDEIEVRNYYRAIEEVERLQKQTSAISQIDIRRLHGFVMTGTGKPTSYRDGQNVIRDGGGKIIYLPPEAHDVPQLMADLVAWIQESIPKNALPVPMIAALVHYQFATIHPYYDGNGRTARLLTTLVLHRAGYGLQGIYSLEEYYAKNLAAYYQALTVGSHNYYSGRASGSVTPFIAYFCAGMAHSLAAVKIQAQSAAAHGVPDHSSQLRKLDPRQRKALTLFQRHSIVTTAELSKHLHLGLGTMRPLCQRWIADGFLVLHDPSQKNRAYRLGEKYEQLFENR